MSKTQRTIPRTHVCVGCGYDVNPGSGLDQIVDGRRSLCPECTLSAWDEGIEPEDAVEMYASFFGGE